MSLLLLFQWQTPETIWAAPSVVPTLAEALAGHHDPVARVLILGDDMVTPLHAIDAVFGQQFVVGGSVTMDDRDLHRTASVVVVDDDGTYLPRSSASLIWPNRIARVQRGAIINGTEHYVDLITGVIDEPKESEDSGQVTFAILSRLHLAERQFGEPVSFPAGDRLSTVVRSIAERAGLGTSDGLYDLSSGGQVLATPVTFDASASMLQSMVRLALDAGCDLYDTGSGVLTMRPFVDPSTVEVTWDFGDDVTLVSLERTMRAVGVYNRQDVSGVGPDGYPIRGRAVVTNPADPLYWTPEFDLPAPVYRPAFPITQQMANAIAQRRLIEQALFEESIAATSVPIPLVEDRDVVRFAGAGVDDGFLLHSVTIPIGPGAMSMSTRRVRSLLS